MKKLITFAVAFFCLSICAFPFDWPQTEIVQSDKFYSYFGQLRGGTISNSLIFSDPSEIKAADSGKVSVVITDFQDDSNFFPSTLGNSIILAHKDSLLTVYGNIDSDSINEALKETSEIETGTRLGYSGNTAWQQGHSSLEFQVIDIKNNAAINPRILMPRVGKELPLYYGEVMLQNRNGKRFKIATQNVIPAGIYKVYRKRQKIAAPYKTRVSINGTLIDQIYYNVLIQSDTQLCAMGKKNYPKSVLYPDEELQLMGETSLSPGKNSIQLSLDDILGVETPATYIVTVY